MEKLVYLAWDDERERGASNDARTHDALRDRLLDRLPKALIDLGATQLKICVTDQTVAAGKALHLGAHEPAAMVSFWLECVAERAVCESLIANCVDRMAGYLVVESQPLKLAARSEAIGQRMSGFTLVGCIEPADGLSHAEFIDRWETTHRVVALETQSSSSYVRNEIVRSLTDDAPQWGGIVEEMFPIEALTDRHVFYDAQGSEERFRANARRMVESCSAFLAIDRVDSHPMSEYRFF